MPPFSAINVEPEENFNDEIDATKQIQVDDALKLFQTALKLHAEGPQRFDEASDAYTALFSSEIFKYADAKTEFEKAESQQGGALASDEPFAAGLEGTTADADGVGTTLPQAYYLSHKNHGQFILDRIRNKARTSKSPAGGNVFKDPTTLRDARKALDDFTAALDRDPSDADLWRKTARVAAFLNSGRISRYSLEAAIELDDDPAVTDVEPPSLAEGFAGQQLKEQLERLEDQVGLTHPIMYPFTEKELPPLLRRHVDPLPFLPNPAKDLATLKLQAGQGAFSPRVILQVPSFSWSSLGMTIVQSDAEDRSRLQAVSPHFLDALREQEVEMEMERQLPVSKNGDAAGDKEHTESREKDAAWAPPEPKSAASDGPTTENGLPTDRRILLPSRKRSQSAAELHESVDDDNAETKRSKRIRRRDTTAEEVMDPATLLATQLQPFQAADHNLFQTTKNILENLGVTDGVTLGRTSEILDSCASDERLTKLARLSSADLRDSILEFDEDAAKVLTGKKDIPQWGLSNFLEHIKSGSQNTPPVPAFDESHGLHVFSERVEAGCFTLHDVACEYLMAIEPSYRASKWSEKMKRTVVHLVSRLDESIYEQVTYELGKAEALGGSADAVECAQLGRVIQMLFELHLDVYERINNPESVVDYTVRMDTKFRIGRWLHVAARAIHKLPNSERPSVLRFLWAAILTASLTEQTTREHSLTCWASLRDYISAVSDHSDSKSGTAIYLPNNTVLPEVSMAAADREMSKITTMDFFLGIFDEDKSNAVSVVTTLEPVLNPDSVAVSVPAENGSQASRRPIKECANQGLRDLWKFMQTSSTELRLCLWAKLGDAYDCLKYKTKQFSCYLRSIEMIMDDFEGDTYARMPHEARRRHFMAMLRALDDGLISALHLALNDNSAFDVVDEAHLRASAGALAKVSCLLHVAAMYEDEIRIGMRQGAGSHAGPAHSAFLLRLREMQVRTWCLQYTVVKVGVGALKEAETDMTSYLAAVHQVLGLRKCCKASNKIFLKMMRAELLTQRSVENWEDHLGQVLYDLHGLRLGVGTWELEDHGCPTETLDRKQAMALVDKVMALAKGMSMKDLLKSDLKTTIEHMQQAIGSAKSTAQMIHNLRNFTEYLKKPIHPLRLYQARRGRIALDAVDVNTPESALARQGWFFLLGMLALTRFKAVDLNRRQTPGATDDLRLAATFLRLQLQFTPDRWEAWFRLAECFDYELDEDVLWTADKMNKERAELVKLQRNAIHCYTLALSYSHERIRDIEAVPDEAESLCDLYSNFGMRLYASSREPFAMEPFQHSDQERFFIDPLGAGTFRKILHGELSPFHVWKYSAYLFRRAMAARPKEWKHALMLAKCLWKMYQAPPPLSEDRDHASRPTMDAVLDAHEKAIEVASALPKPRHGQDPILEPHYKIVSIVYKLVRRGDMEIAAGVEVLQRQPMAPKQDAEASGNIGDHASWLGYMIKYLRHLRDKDKSNWQHRLIIRHAHVLFQGPNHLGIDCDEPSSTWLDESSRTVQEEEKHDDNVMKQEAPEARVDPPHGEGNGQSQSEGQSREESQDGAEAGRKARTRRDVHAEGVAAAQAAFNVLRESMFTKTMVMNVWKCDAERPGRHHVYTEQYIRLVVRLLAVTKDRANMKAVLQRIRKKGADFYHFTELWQWCVAMYVRLLRRSFEIKHHEEDVFKHFAMDDFDAVAEKIAAWVTDPSAQEVTVLQALKEAIDIKKLNASLVKAGPIDDLIVDAYTSAYALVKPDMPAPAPPPSRGDSQQPPPLKRDEERGDTSVKLFSSLLHPHDHEARSKVFGAVYASSEQPGAAAMHPQQSSTGETAPRARRVGIRRPDILRKAEMAVTRPVEGPLKASNSNKTQSRVGSTCNGKNTGTSSRPGSTGSTENSEDESDAGEANGAPRTADSDDGDDKNDDHDEDVLMKDAEESQVNGRHGPKMHAQSDASSQSGSVHDSADDESDLSELSDVPPDYEDDIASSLLFPSMGMIPNGAAKGPTSTPDERSVAGSPDVRGEAVIPATSDEDMVEVMRSVS